MQFKINGQDVDTLDPVRYRAVLAYIDRLGPEAGAFEWIRALGSGGEVDGPALVEELNSLAHRGVPEDVARMLGNIENDVLRTLRSQGKLGPTE